MGWGWGLKLPFYILPALLAWNAQENLCTYWAFFLAMNTFPKYYLDMMTQDENNPKVLVL